MADGEARLGEALVLSERHGGVVVVTFNRPAVLNAFNTALWAAFGEALAPLADDDSRVLVLTGAGSRAFSAGADMREVAAASAEETRARGGQAVGLGGCWRCAAVIAAINGYAYGGGAILATMCDIRIADATARFRFPGAAYGLVAGTAFLPRVVGLPQAMDLALSARPVEANEALAMGLVNRVTPAGEALPAALALAEQIAANEPAAVFATKQALRASLNGDLAAARAREAAFNRGYVGSDEHRRVFGDFVRGTLDRGQG
jgi:enoyl-CoA hydratase/carnithine racemase